MRSKRQIKTGKDRIVFSFHITNTLVDLAKLGVEATPLEL